MSIRLPHNVGYIRMYYWTGTQHYDGRLGNTQAPQLDIKEVISQFHSIFRHISGLISQRTALAARDDVGSPQTMENFLMSRGKVSFEKPFHLPKFLIGTKMQVTKTHITHLKSVYFKRLHLSSPTTAPPQTMLLLCTVRLVKPNLLLLSL